MNGFVLIILILLLIATVAGIAAAVAIPIARSRHRQRSVLTNSWVKAKEKLPPADCAACGW